MSHNKILTDINEYYSQKLREHGTTPKGVDWNGIESQELRFKTLLNINNNLNKVFVRIKTKKKNPYLNF